MKKNFIYLSMLLFVLLSCNKSEVEPLFEESANKRVTTAIDTYKKQLSGAEFGWKGEYYPDGGKAGGYSFYLKFDASGKVTMYSDIDEISYAYGGGSYFGNGYDKAFETTYQVKSLQKPTLIFDSYSYLHELVNPDYNGGAGQLADLELEFSAVSDTKISLVGNKNKTQMTLTKLAKTESDLLAKGGLASVFNGTYDYLTTTDKFITLVLPSGDKADVDLNLSTKSLSLFYYNAKVKDYDVVSTAFVTTTTGVQFKDPITIYGVTFQEMFWDSIAKTYYINVSGKRVNLTLASKPVLPFYYALGTLFQGFNMSPAIPSQSAEYKALYAKIKSNVIALSTAAPVRVIGNVYFQYLPDQNVFVLVVEYRRTNPDGSLVFNGASVLYYQASSDGKGNIVFGKSYQNATLSGGQLSLGASGIVLAGIKPLTDIIENNAFQWDYDPVETRIAVLKSVPTTANPTVFTIKGALF
jgi:Domain of unknown function (DUF4302)